ncbi:MAG: DNA-directed DNA polymerase [Thermoprotei archaeon]
MEANFYILDFSYDIEEQKPWVYLWAIDESGNRVALIETEFRPYFYAVIGESNEQEIISKVKKLSKPSSPIIEVTQMTRNYYGKPVKVLKIVTVVPALVRTYREEVAKIEGVKAVLEADIRFAMRYAIDNDVRPFTWIRAEVEEMQNSEKLRVSKVYRLVKILERDLNLRPPKLRTLAFDIEVYNKYGAPNPRRDPVIIIGVWSEEGLKQFVSETSEKDAIKKFVEYVQSYDPDIILGYNSSGFDLPYLLERAKANGIKLDIGRRPNSEPNQGVYGHYSISGRLHVDLMGFVRYIAEVKVKSLDNVADYLGVMKKSERVLIEWYDIPKYWDDKEKRQTLLKYNADDAKSTYLLGDVFIPFGIELSRITGLPLDQLAMASMGNRVEWLLIREAFKFNELVPNKEEREYEGYEGGMVFEPLPGIHHDVYVLDFSSMYPSIMIKYNVGPDTLVEGECDDCYVAPFVGHKFRKDPPGFYKQVLKKLVDERKAVKKLMESAKDEYERRIYEERQKALKILANTFYGYMGWLGARWYSKEGAEAVTAWGRKTISEAAEIAKSMGFTVVYGDTDSMFVKGGKNVEELVKAITSKFDLEIKVDKVYKKVFFTENKKRYAGLTEDGKVDIVGFEAVRGDWCDLAKEVQRVVIEKILMTDKVDEAVKYVKETIMKLRRGEFKLEDLIIWKSLDKDLNEYDVEAPHVVAAKKAMRNGYLVTKGTKIGYVVVKGSGKLSDRAEPYFLVKDKSRIDVEYYVDKQIVPAAMRILERFGIKESSLKTTGGTDILSFFKR